MKNKKGDCFVCIIVTKETFPDYHNIMNKIYIAIIFIIILIYFNQTSLASTQQSLKGISAVAIRIDALPAFARDDGLSEIAIKQSIENQLAENNIKVVAYKDWETMLGGSYLYVKIVPSKSYTGDRYLMYTEIELNQTVVLIKAELEQNKVIHGTTWSAGKLMNCETISLRTCLRESITQLVDIFIQEYKKVN